MGPPLWWAMKDMDIATAIQLVKDGADVSATGRDSHGNKSTPLWWACKSISRGMSEDKAAEMIVIVKMLQDGGASMRETGKYEA